MLFRLFRSPTVLFTMQFHLFVSVSLASCLPVWQVSVCVAVFQSARINRAHAACYIVLFRFLLLVVGH